MASVLTKKARFGYKTGGYIFHISIRAFDRSIKFYQMLFIVCLSFDNRVIDNEIFIYSKVKRIPKIYKIADDIYSFCPQGTRDVFQ